MSNSTPIPSSYGEHHPGSLQDRAKELRVYTNGRALLALYTSLARSFGYGVLTEVMSPAMPRPQETAEVQTVQEEPKPYVPHKITPVDVEIAAGQRSMLEETAPEDDSLEDIRRMINELHDEENS
jgi:hypothetical protein